MRQEDIPKTSFITHSGHYEFLVMWWKCNAPSTFQDIVNTIYEPYLRKFVLVFFDDILIYSTDWAMHLVHLKKVLELLKKHQLYAKRNKCTFTQMKVEYLGHIISWEGVATDPQKVECMLKWPTPTTVKALRGFFGLTGYYRKFIKGYGVISKPLTLLLKKNACEWNHEAEEAFNQLKEVMTTAPVLAMPDFSKPFIVETDASGKGIGVVLMQEDRSITYQSKALAAKNLGLSTYEKEFLALILAVTKWRYYLQRNHFIIRTNQKSLKHILDQRIDSVLLQKWVAKLLGLSYEVQYQKGSENRAADALLRVGHEQEESQSNAITTQPLPIPEQAWSCISMDFIEGLPSSEGKDSILVGVDRITKYSHFIALKHPYTATSIAKLFFDNIYKLHGLPTSIVTDKDKIFTSKFWKELFSLSGVSLDMSSDYHPQSDGQTERVNQCLENYLRCMCHQKPKWAQWLTLAEFWSNTNFHTGLAATPSKLFMPTHRINCPLVLICKTTTQRLVPRNNVGIPQVLIQWSHSSPDQATWEDYKEIATKFPGFDPWGQGSKKGGRNVVFTGQNTILDTSRTMKGADIDRAIKGSFEFGSNLISPAESDAVLGQLGSDQIEEGIGDFSGETYPN
ncbi:UNVERIFIED_CONTAM: Retrovirus-related Pol polyprotein from transposon [Sesamum radiatum]|uniref:Retrovirus-related Pol polyprotein from transposon n=1 Tax=Sesamum radiatum TaxID=300843 RepID=A0AAW2M0P7_SESRA